MSYKNLDILVLIRECSDSRPPARTITRGAGISGRGLRRIPNQRDLIALEEALKLKERVGAQVTVLAIGNENMDDTLRLAFSMGADWGIRIWDHALENGDSVADARILNAALSILSPDLFFTGNSLQDRGDDPVPALASALLGVPCISSVVAQVVKNSCVEVLRKSDRGSRQEVATNLPCTLLFDEGDAPRYPSISAVTKALDAKIEIWDLSKLGMAFHEVGLSGSLLELAEFGTPRTDPVRVVTPDASLPAFERIIALLSGGIKAREGKLSNLSADETTEALWKIFCEEGIIPAAAP